MTEEQTKDMEREIAIAHMGFTPLLRAKDVARILAVTRRTVYRWAADGTLPAVRLKDNTVRFDTAAVARFLEEASGGAA